MYDMIKKFSTLFRSLLQLLRLDTDSYTKCTFFKHFSQIIIVTIIMIIIIMIIKLIISL